jgi:flagellar basal body-associated protein FliL
MGGFQPWHWLIVLVLLAIVVVVVVIAVVVVRMLTKPKPPPPNHPSAVAPGWYPDPRDPTAMRYFDGHDWIRSDGPPN